MGTGVAPALWTVGKPSDSIPDPQPCVMTLLAIHASRDCSAWLGFSQARRTQRGSWVRNESISDSLTLITEYLSRLERLVHFVCSCVLRHMSDRPCSSGKSPNPIGQASRAISIGQLHTLLRFHLQPIKHLVLVCSLGDRSPREISS